MQDGKPISYASRAMTDTEQNYAQIEKKLLAIVFAYDRFIDYIYGRDSVHLETDHKPLESIFKKEIHMAPKLLQRMILRLQKFPLEVRFSRCRYSWKRKYYLWQNYSFHIAISHIIRVSRLPGFPLFVMVIMSSKWYVLKSVSVPI